MNEQKFVDGLYVNELKNAPDFVNAKLSIGPKFIDWYNSNKNEKGYVNIDILTSKTGKQYAKHNDFKPKEQGQSFSQVPATESEDTKELPF